MKVTDLTRIKLKHARERRRLERAGYEEVTERGGKLWELHRGGRLDHVIVDAVPAPEGKTVFVKIEASA